MTQPSPLTRDFQEDDSPERSLRPERLIEFIGQPKIRDNLEVFIKAALTRRESLDHVLLFGPPGLGKTTLAHIIAREMGVSFKPTSGPMITKAGDLAALLTNLQPRDVLFIDEIHRLTPAVEEVLYPALEDFKLDLMIGEGPAARSVQIDLPPFTLVGATTRSGLITKPLRERFGIHCNLEFYGVQDLEKILNRAAGLLGIHLTPEGAQEIAQRSRGTPRIAGRLLRRVRDFAVVAKVNKIDKKIADNALKKLEVDEVGFDSQDRRYMTILQENYNGGPVGVETICAVLSESRDVIEDVIEPYLLQQGFLQRTPRGRILTPKAYGHLGIAVPPRPHQTDLLMDSGN